MDDFSADDFQSLCVKINSVLKEQNIMQPELPCKLVTFTKNNNNTHRLYNTIKCV